MSDLVIVVHFASFRCFSTHIRLTSSSAVSFIIQLTSASNAALQSKADQNISEVNPVTRAGEEEDVKEYIETRVSDI